MAAKLKYTRQDGFVHPGWLLGVRVLMLAALAVAAYLLWISVGSGASAGCGPNSNCDKVLHSRWSRWLGVPISAVGLLVYGTILAGTFWLRRSVPPADQRKAWGWLIPCSIAVIGAAIWFAAVQGLILKKFCPFCLTAHACAAVAAVILLWCAPFRRPPEKPWQQEKQVFVPPGSGRKLAWMGLVPVTVLIAGQIVRWPQREYVVKIFDGKIQMNLREVPVIGAPDAPHSIISLFDYTCDPCRTMHGHLMAAHQKFSNELAIINLPMPLCEKCNHRPLD